MIITDGCIICGEKTASPFLSTKNGDLVKCSCGFIYLFPQPTAEELNALYSEDYVPFQQKTSGTTWESTHSGPHYKVLRAIKRAIIPAPKPMQPDMQTKKTVLDFGYGNGRWLLQMKAQHPLWTLYGYDIDSRPLSGVTTTSSLEDIKKLGPVFDLINLKHVVEHLPDPKATLLELKQLLKEDGEIVVEVPNITSWKFKVFKKNFTGLCLPYHLSHFSPATMKKLAEQCGFTVTSTKLLGNPKGTLRSIYNVLGITRNITPYETLAVEIVSNAITRGKIDTEALQVVLRIAN